MVLIADFEESNQQTLKSIKISIEEDRFLCVPSLINSRCPYCWQKFKSKNRNWFLQVENERSYLAMIRNMRNRASSNVIKELLESTFKKLSLAANVQFPKLWLKMKTLNPYYYTRILDAKTDFACLSTMHEAT